MLAEDKKSYSRDQVMETGVELTIRLGVLGLLLFFSFLLVRPFISIAIWSVVLTVALYPVYSSIVDLLGGAAPIGGSPAYSSQPPDCDRTRDVARVWPDRECSNPVRAF